MSRPRRILHVAPLMTTLDLFVTPLKRQAAADGFDFWYGSGEVASAGAHALRLPLSRGSGSFGDWAHASAMLGAIRDIGPDLVHVHTPAAALSMRPILGRLDCPALYIARGGFSEGTSAMKRVGWRLVDPGRWRVWASVLTVNQIQKARLSRARRQTVQCVPHGAVPLRPSGEVSEPDDGWLTLAWVGRFDADKRPEDFLEVVARLQRERLKVRAVMIGGSLAGDRVPRAFAKRLSEARNVSLPGWVADPVQWLRGADLLVHTSVREGYGLVFHEAAALGIPSVVYQNEGTLDSVPAVRGCLVPRRDVAALVDVCRRYAGGPPEAKRQWRLAVHDAAVALDGQTVWPVIRSEYERVLR